MSNGDDVDLANLSQTAPPDELWLISYADLLTLLIGFLALLLSAAPLKQARFEQIVAALSGEKEVAPLTELRTKVEELVEKRGLGDKVIAREDAQGLGIEFKDVLLFDLGSAAVRPEGNAVVGAIAELIRALPTRPIIVEGHTDDLPIHTAAFASNWDLGAKRAINVLQSLEQAGVPAERMSARSFAHTQMVRGSGTPEELRAASRRVVIRVE